MTKNKNFRLRIDVTMTGDVFVMAKSKKEAKEKIKSLSFVPSDLRTFCHIKTLVVDVGEE